jgi:hypothetical protein
VEAEAKAQGGVPLLQLPQPLLCHGLQGRERGSGGWRAVGQASTGRRKREAQEKYARPHAVPASQPAGQPTIQPARWAHQHVLHQWQVCCSEVQRACKPRVASHN